VAAPTEGTMTRVRGSKQTALGQHLSEESTMSGHRLVQLTFEQGTLTDATVTRIGTRIHYRKRPSYSEAYSPF
jgi:hypothetical protein